MFGGLFDKRKRDMAEAIDSQERNIAVARRNFPPRTPIPDKLLAVPRDKRETILVVTPILRPVNIRGQGKGKV